MMLALFASVSLVKEARNSPMVGAVLHIFHSLSQYIVPAYIGHLSLASDNFLDLRNVKRYVIIFTFGLIPVAPFYIQNFLNYGSLISDSPFFGAWPL